MSEDDRIKEDESIKEGLDLDTVHHPLLIIEVNPDGRHQIRINLNAVPRDPRAFGVLMSDTIDHLASAYQRIADRDPHEVRAAIYSILISEEKLKQKDPSRGNLRATTVLVPKKSHH